MYIDLTLEVSEKIPPFPGDPKMETHDLFTLKKDSVNEKRVSFNSHFSTHIDAPFHMIPDGKKLEDFPLSVFFGKATIVDVQNKTAIGLRDLPQKIITPFVLFFTNHIRKIRTKDYYKNNPVITEESAKILVRSKVKIVGIDSFTPDNYPYSVHKILFRNNILIIENLVNLDLLKKFCQIFIAPLNLRNADGAPVRVIAKNE